VWFEIIKLIGRFTTKLSSSPAATSSVIFRPNPALESFTSPPPYTNSCAWTTTWQNLREMNEQIFIMQPPCREVDLSGRASGYWSGLSGGFSISWCTSLSNDSAIRIKDVKRAMASHGLQQEPFLAFRLVADGIMTTDH